MEDTHPRAEGSLTQFLATMPKSYRHVFSERGMTDHAALVAARGDAVVRVGRFHSRRDLKAAPLCVVADDRPGLLAVISAALVTERLDVVHAEAYTRQRSGVGPEAVDVFWVHDRGGPERQDLDEDRLRSFEDTLRRFLLGERSLEEAQVSVARPTAAHLDTTVRFIEDGDGQLGVLEVETVDRAGLLLALSQALFTQQVQIVRSEVHTYRDRVQDRFSIRELDGNPIGAERRLAIQVAVLAAIDPNRRG